MEQLLKDVKAILVEEFLPAIPNLAVDLGRLNETLIALDTELQKIEEKK